MGLPPRPKSRPLVRRAVVASVLATTGCDQGAKPAPVPEQKQQLQPQDALPEPVPVPPQVAPPPQVEPAPLPPPDAGPPQVTLPPQVAHATPPKFASGFIVQLVDEADKPLVKKQVTITLDTGETLTATTSDRGMASFRRRISNTITVSIAVRGYQTLTNAQIDSDMHPAERFVLRKR